MVRHGLEIIGHRGVAGHAPENTLAGLRAAAAFGLAHAEVDARLTGDGAAVLVHDATLERTTSGRGRVADVPLATITGLDAGSWFAPSFRGERVPTLGEALAAAAALGLTLNVEIKAETGAAAAETGALVARAIAGAPLEQSPAYVSSFWEEALTAARDAAPGVARALLVADVPDDWERRLQSTGATALHAAADHLSSAMGAAVRGRGVPLRCYTVNTATDALRLSRMGVAALFSDFPDRIGG